ncbi:MAG: hypothetical protein B7Z37_25575 [Verrucomicrobia bacterium 12-59-8]|nr:MAG: hypothetical protein B7Z37_25575 [Verrucomicrobia bacterium 12-59-8]
MPWAWLLVCFGVAENVWAEEHSAAIASKKVSVTFSGTGGSSGDSVMAAVKLTDQSGVPLELTIEPGTRLKSGSSSVQSMVVAGVKGEMTGRESYRRSSTITARSTPATYVLDAYCAEFEKSNPGSSTHFSVGSVDPILACILEGTSSLSVRARQAAVWIYTDKATFGRVTQKFYVSTSDWDAAAAVVRNCLSKPGGSVPAASEHPSSTSLDKSLPSDLEIAARSATSGRRFKIDASGHAIVEGEPPPTSSTPPAAEAAASARPVRIRIDGNGHRIVDGAAQAPATPTKAHAAAVSTRTRPVKIRIDGNGHRIVDGAAQAPAMPPSAEAAASTRPVRIRIDGNGHRIVDEAAQAPAAPTTAPATTPAAPADSKESPDETAWKQTDKIAEESLQKYLTLFPEGAHSKDARIFLGLTKQLHSIAAGTSKADVVIPFEALGKQWQFGGARQGIAFSYSRTEKEGAMTGAFWRTPSLDYRGIRSGARGSFADENFSRWPESAPTGNGSIVAFDTQGDECPLRTAPVIVSDKGGIVYFGVVEKIGLVHLSGKGRVIFADGSTKNLE